MCSAAGKKISPESKVSSSVLLKWLHHEMSATSGGILVFKKNPNLDIKRLEIRLGAASKHHPERLL